MIKARYWLWPQSKWHSLIAACNLSLIRWIKGQFPLPACSCQDPLCWHSNVKSLWSGGASCRMSSNTLTLTPTILRADFIQRAIVEAPKRTNRTHLLRDGNSYGLNRLQTVWVWLPFGLGFRFWKTGWRFFQAFKASYNHEYSHVSSNTTGNNG